jgi:hypothetical protein
MRGPAVVRGVTRALYGVAQDIAVDAAISITAGAVSGKGHVPSAPGEPPNADTHVLDRSIIGVSTGALKAETQADAPYAAAQELGTSTLPERPYLRPAAAKNRPNALAKVSAAVDKVIRANG